ncbi:hypothetical protein GCK72_023385 [Caenorhabditis remanei]|uniref:Uncharacterized protein n=1 Tax=Caenorhabditis remanei TaxID=31234 RepID=A0A6A5FWP4_CAERE|nr:hypothetical protein GCK72_023385 [Caenorhabditis remanei]KAF1746927.1 hypothetical protein GCK72_023385 [Caenorhabditis remanei]
MTIEIQQLQHLQDTTSIQLSTPEPLLTHYLERIINLYFIDFKLNDHCTKLHFATSPMQCFNSQRTSSDETYQLSTKQSLATNINMQSFSNYIASINPSHACTTILTQTPPTYQICNNS